MNKPTWGAHRGVLWVVGMLLAAGAARAATEAAAPAPLDPQAIIKETQQMSHPPGGMTMTWWIPVQFWEATVSNDPRVTPASAEAIVKALSGYTMVAVMDARVGALGSMEYTPAATLATEVSIKDAAGNLYAPVAEDQIEGDARTFLAMMRPFLSNMLGALGQNMQFLVFPARGKNGQAIADATRDGVFYVEVGKSEFRWRLPLGSVLPRKTCPVCKESLSGAYKYCPYDGTKLPDTPAVAAKP
jgi:hypothetical protein